MVALESERQKKLSQINLSQEEGQLLLDSLYKDEEVILEDSQKELLETQHALEKDGSKVLLTQLSQDELSQQEGEIDLQS